MKYLILPLFFVVNITSYGQKETKEWPTGKWYTVSGTDTSFMDFSPESYTVNYKMGNQEFELTGTVTRINENIFEIVYNPKPHLENQYFKIIDIQPGVLTIQSSMYRNFSKKVQFQCFPQ
jgi:hypothetical protein